MKVTQLVDRAKFRTFQPYDAMSSTVGYSAPALEKSRIRYSIKYFRSEEFYE